MYYKGKKIGPIIKSTTTPPKYQNKTVTATLEDQYIKADTGYTAIKKLTVNAVSSDIDPDIKSENINSGISILGVTGNYVGSFETKYNDYLNRTLTSVSKEDLTGVTQIGDFSFISFTELTSFECPSTVTNIGNGSFKDCSKLSTLILNGDTVKSGGSNCLLNTKISIGDGYIYVKDELVDLYKNDEQWSIYANQIKAISELN